MRAGAQGAGTLAYFLGWLADSKRRELELQIMDAKRRQLEMQMDREPDLKKQRKLVYDAQKFALDVAMKDEELREDQREFDAAVIEAGDPRLSRRIDDAKLRNLDQIHQLQKEEGERQAAAGAFAQKIREGRDTGAPGRIEEKQEKRLLNELQYGKAREDREQSLFKGEMAEQKYESLQRAGERPELQGEQAEQVLKNLVTQGEEMRAAGGRADELQGDRVDTEAERLFQLQMAGDFLLEKQEMQRGQSAATIGAMESQKALSEQGLSQGAALFDTKKEAAQTELRAQKNRESEAALRLKELKETVAAQDAAAGGKGYKRTVAEADIAALKTTGETAEARKDAEKLNLKLMQYDTASEKIRRFQESEMDRMVVESTKMVEDLRAFATDMTGAPMPPDYVDNFIQRMNATLKNYFQTLETLQGIRKEHGLPTEDLDELYNVATDFAGVALRELEGEPIGERIGHELLKRFDNELLGGTRKITTEDIIRYPLLAILSDWNKGKGQWEFIEGIIPGPGLLASVREPFKDTSVQEKEEGAFSQAVGQSVRGLSGFLSEEAEAFGADLDVYTHLAETMTGNYKGRWPAAEQAIDKSHFGRITRGLEGIGKGLIDAPQRSIRMLGDLLGIGGGGAPPALAPEMPTSRPSAPPNGVMPLETPPPPVQQQQEMTPEQLEQLMRLLGIPEMRGR